MAMKYTIDKLEDVAENVRPLYVAQGGKFILDVEGVVEKTRLDEFRNNNILLQQQIDKFKGVDPAKYTELMEIQRKLQEKELIEAGKVDEVVNLRVNTMRETFDTEKTTLTSQLTAANQQLNMLLIDNVVKTSAIKLGVIPEAIDDVVLRAKNVYTIENGVPTPKNADGVIYGKDGKSPMAVTEWLDQLKTSAKHLFATSTGTGANGGNRAGGTPLANMTPAQKISMGLAQGIPKGP